MFHGVRDPSSFTFDTLLCVTSILEFASKSKKAAPAPALGTTFQPGGRGKRKEKDAPTPLRTLQEVVHNTFTYIPLARM